MRANIKTTNTLMSGEGRVQHRQRPQQRRRPAPKKRSASQVVSIVLFEMLATIAIIVAMFITYSLIGTGWETDKAQQQLNQELGEAWGSDTNPNAGGNGDAQSPTIETASTTTNGGDGAYNPNQVADKDNPYANTPKEDASNWKGGPLGIMTVPAWGEDWRWVIVHGTRPQDIRKGPGWYPSTQVAGERGNMAVAAHESGFNAPFSRIWETLPVCTQVKIETKTMRYTYRVLPHKASDEKDFEACAPTAYPAWRDHYRALPRPVYATEIVDTHQSEVLNPIPGTDSAVIPGWSIPLLTLQTCYPHLQSTQRVVVRAALTQAEAK